MLLFAIVFFLLTFFSGVVLINFFLPKLSRIVKFPAAFFIGIYFSTMIVFIISILLPVTNEVLLSSLILTTSFLTIFLMIVFFRHKSLFAVIVSRFEIIVFFLLFIVSLYIMNKSFSYANGNFLIASNVYSDFGIHIPIIRSFSMGENIPPTFPIAAGIPLLYHFFFDFAVACYEKFGLRIDYAFNFLSALSLIGVLFLLYSLSQELFGKKKFIGIVAVLLFLFNSSLSFLNAVTTYWGSHFLTSVYHHAIYLGNGPFGDSIVSVFWNLNTYLNQRHFLFTLGLFLIIVHYLYSVSNNRHISFPWVFLGIITGLLPFWHMGVFLAVIVMGSIIFLLQIVQKKVQTKFFAFLLLASVIALPQLIAIKQLQSIVFPFFHQGFLIAGHLTIQSFFQYWLYNLGLSFLLIPIGIMLSKKKQKLFFVSIFILFLLPNLFQFSPQIYDNHKLLNMFILLANIYTAYVLWLLWKKQYFFKIVSFILLFFLTFSGMIDFMVIKNDIKTNVTDYPNDIFLQWIQKYTDPHAVFLTNADIYDPITLVGRKSFLGKSHYIFTYGISPDERLHIKANVVTSSDTKSTIALLHKYHIKYVIFYKEQNLLEKRLSVVYRDKDHIVLLVQ